MLFKIFDYKVKLYANEECNWEWFMFYAPFINFQHDHFEISVRVKRMGKFKKQ